MAAGNSRFVFSQAFCLSLESCTFKLIHGIAAVGAGLCSEGLISRCSVLRLEKKHPPVEVRGQQSEVACLDFLMLCRGVGA